MESISITQPKTRNLREQIVADVGQWEEYKKAVKIIGEQR